MLKENDQEWKSQKLANSSLVEDLTEIGIRWPEVRS